MTIAIETIENENRCTCVVCDVEYDYIEDLGDATDECPDCIGRRLAEENKEEAIADAQGEVDEAECDLWGLMEELADLKARIREARLAVRAAKKKLAAAQA